MFSLILRILESIVVFVLIISVISIILNLIKAKRKSGEMNRKVLINLIYLFLSCELILTLDKGIEMFLKTSLVGKIWSIGILIIFVIPYYVFLKQKYKNFIEVKKIEDEIGKNIIDIKYYRETLKYYSPGVVNYIYNRKINVADVFMATILQLENEGIIEINNTYLKILKVANIKSDNVNFLLEKISKISIDNKVEYRKISRFLLDPSFIYQWKEEIRKETVKLNMYREKEEPKYKNINKIAILALIINPIIGVALNKFGFVEDIILAANVFIATILSMITIFMTSNNIKIMILTEKGMENQRKLIGIKKYIKEYSMIQAREVSEIKIWDEYMIYAIIFDIKGELDKRVNELYKKMLTINK